MSETSATERDQTIATANTIEVPAPTPWPLTMALGATLLAAGLVTTGLVSLLGAGLLIAGAVGWFRQVLPEERCIAVPLVPEAQPTIAPRPPTTHPEVAEREHRARVPVEVYPISAGIKGGIAGGVVMALLAIAYGLISHGSVWYPINLLAAGVSGPALGATTAQLSAFHADGLAMATLIHGLASLLVGTLYGALLPIVPRRPILVGGVAAPLAWTALLYPTIGIINPVLAHRINWGWFIASQIGFGLTAGFVVSRSLRIPTPQSGPFVEHVGHGQRPGR
jgi:hypothetical protein